MIDTDKRAHIRALAEKATPGPWRALDLTGRDPYCVTSPTGLLAHTLVGYAACVHVAKANAAYIAALSPEVVLALLDAADRAERDIRTMVEKAAAQSLDGYRELGQRAADAERQRDAERARAERLAEALRLFLALDPTFESATDDELRDIAGRKYYPSQKLAQAVIAARAALADPAPEVKP